MHVSGSVPRPLPESSIMAALNWQVQNMQQSWQPPAPEGFSAGPVGSSSLTLISGPIAISMATI